LLFTRGAPLGPVEQHHQRGSILIGKPQRPEKRSPLTTTTIPRRALPRCLARLLCHEPQIRTSGDAVAFYVRDGSRTPSRVLNTSRTGFINAVYPFVTDLPPVSPAPLTVFSRACVQNTPPDHRFDSATTPPNAVDSAVDMATGLSRVLMHCILSLSFPRWAPSVLKAGKCRRLTARTDYAAHPRHDPPPRGRSGPPVNV
jgi:hypothetical protein